MGSTESQLSTENKLSPTTPNQLSSEDPTSNTATLTLSELPETLSEDQLSVRVTTTELPLEGQSTTTVLELSLTTVQELSNTAVTTLLMPIQVLLLEESLTQRRSEKLKRKTPVLML